MSAHDIHYSYNSLQIYRTLFITLFYSLMAKNRGLEAALNIMQNRCAQLEREIEERRQTNYNNNAE
jgi:hypothetical protein